MKGLILAAGRGSRMGYLTDALPKCMQKFKGISLVDRHLDAFKKSKIQEVAIVCGYLKDKIKSYDDIIKYENKKWAKTNMVRSLMRANSWLKEADNIVTYGDIFFEDQAITALMSTKSEIAITYDVNFKKMWKLRFKNPFDDLETFIFNKKNILVNIGQKTSTYKEVLGQYMGLLKISANGWDIIKKNLKELSSKEIDVLDMTSLLNILINKKIEIEVVPYSGQWGEIDRPSDIEVYEKLYKLPLSI